tara:strand:+ start:1406 stop:4738 length:3333 start_codon:yes stop_codon:yes gene_type:complete
MATALLDKLKVKKSPQVKNIIEVQFKPATKQETIEIKTKIIDKRNEDTIDRITWIENIEQKLKVHKKFSQAKPSSVQIPKKKTKKLKTRLKLVPVEETKEQLSEIPVPKMPETEIPVPEIPVSEIPVPEIPVPEMPSIKRQSPIKTVKQGPLSMLKIGDTPLNKRINKPTDNTRIQASSYYMNNREIFVNFMISLFGKYKSELGLTESEATCNRDDDSEFSPMAHQKIVRDYIAQFTPYRGVLLFHGLGSGKTCSSIAITEGMKTSKQVIIMTPASLRMNYVEELKKCGDSLYRKNQFWEFINTQSQPTIIDHLSSVLQLSVEYIEKQGGAWLMNITKPSNFNTLDSSQKKSLDLQLNEMIRYKYKFINYNGLRMSNLKNLTQNFTINPFDNAVVVIDEAHNFVSRIVNKLGKEDTLSGKLYDYLMSADEARIVLLTGTPIINYPNEIAILFNILRGYIKTWTFQLTINKEKKISKDYFESIFKSTILGGNIMDYISYNHTNTKLVITRNPFGFVNKTRKNTYEGVRIGDRGQISDVDFINLITKILSKNDITVNPNGISVTNYKALPDTLSEFQSYFIDQTGEVKNMNLFKKRILGLTSYFRDMVSLMPRYDKSEDFHIVHIPMSDFQFSVYEEARVQERKLELQNAKRRKRGTDNVFEDTSSTYRIFSRAFCNFVFPRPHIIRPLPGKSTDIENTILQETADEDLLDAVSIEEKKANVDGRYEIDELEQLVNPDNESYDQRITSVLKQLKTEKDRFLTPKALEIYSPKFLNILENVENAEHKGLHLIYSQFRTLEGIGILKLIFEANGFAQFKLKKEAENWILDIPEDSLGKPMFGLYTGTETPEEKELLRNVFNGTWQYLPPSLATQLKKRSSNNLYGEIIKVIMITASGAEGISLKNVRYVHITEPYWHPVRLEQVIGRARRLCSHQELPEELRTVKVFLYLMTFTKSQLESDDSIELRLKDKSKIDNITPVTTDEALYEISTAKEKITKSLLLAVKEASIDCALHSKAGDKEKLKCFSFGSVNSSKFSFLPSYSEEDDDKDDARNKRKITWQATEIELDGIKYALNQSTGDVYNLESYIKGNPIQIGKLIIEGTGKKQTYRLEFI